MKFKQIKSLNELKVGDLIKGKSSELGYIVTANYGNRLTATRTQDVTNPDEWELFIVGSLEEKLRQQSQEPTL
jgi:hypothetical protein